MFYTIYSAIKTQLASLVAEGYPVEWFNNQYEGTMRNPQGFYIEFPDPVPVLPLSKEAQRKTVKVRLHFYTQLIQTDDGIPDASVSLHEETVTNAVELINGCKPVATGNRMLTTSWQHYHRWRGWLVTMVDFELKVS